MRKNGLLLLAVACVPPEKGIDNTLITGTVRIEAERVTEADEEGNNHLRTPEALDDLYVATRLVSGTLASFDAADPDVDAYAITSRSTLPEQTLSISLSDPAATVKLDLYNTDRVVDGRPLFLGSATVTGQGTLPFPSVSLGPDTGYTVADSGLDAGPRMVGGVQYLVAVTALSGTAGTGYTLTLPGLPPSLVPLLVGAFPDGDPAAHGEPIGGSTVEDWRGGTAADDYAWTGTYNLYLLRTLTGEGLGVEAHEGAEKVWLLAGDWPTLNSPLASGTWYSGTALPLEVPQTLPESNAPADALKVPVEGTLVLDTFAEAIVVQEFAESEPNNLQPTWPPAVDLSTAADAGDAGMLTGPGFADRFTGTIVYGPDLYGYTHDSDAWRFTVPEPSRLLVSATWDDVSACLDIYVVDSVDGLGLDYAANFEQPEVGGGEYVYQPDTTYYLVMLGYAGAPEGASTAYNMLVEQLPP